MRESSNEQSVLLAIRDVYYNIVGMYDNIV